MARNTDVTPYIGKLSRSQVYSKKGLYKRERKGVPSAEPTAAEKRASYYPADDSVQRPKISRKTNKPTKLRESIVPGSIVILLAGRFRGKRVVVLGQLPSGLLLVTGPYVINGVPVRRVNQSYVIATSTKVELPQGLDLAKFNDAYFTKDKSSSRKGTEGEFFDKESKPAKKELPAERAQDQKALDKQVLGAVKQTPVLAKYLAASFGLSKGEFPHLLKF
ncbi:hypothetical protein JCM8202_004441 [Rhodotorula sphaerocarpa]